MHETCMKRDFFFFLKGHFYAFTGFGLKGQFTHK